MGARKPFRGTENRILRTRTYTLTFAFREREQLRFGIGKQCARQNRRGSSIGTESARYPSPGHPKKARPLRARVLSTVELIRRDPVPPRKNAEIESPRRALSQHDVLPERRFPPCFGNGPEHPREIRRRRIPPCGRAPENARDTASRRTRHTRFHLPAADGSLRCPVTDVPRTGRRFLRRTVIHLLERARDSPVRAGKSAFESPGGTGARDAAWRRTRRCRHLGLSPVDAMLVDRGAMLIGGKSQVAHEICTEYFKPD